MGRVASPRIASPIERRTTGELVAEHVRRLIFSGELRSGDRIPQDELAADLGVSRLPVREAVMELARDGLVTVAPHSGAFVAPFDADVVREHFQIVGMIQGLAAAELATRPEPDAIDRLRAITDRIHAAASDDDPAATHAATMEFLRVMNLAGGSVRQQAVLRALARMLPSGFFAELPGAAAAEQQGADRILAAIESGSADRARDACVDVQRAHAEIVIRNLCARGVFAVEA
jgi:DNA-binding GntR family transcriptional regulator